MFQNIISSIVIMNVDLRCLLDALLESLDQTLESYNQPGDRAEVDTDKPREEKRSSGQTSRILNLITFLISQPSIKAAFINLSQGTGYAITYTVF